jgi:hypothetical protein
MEEKSEIKITRTYSLDPAVVAWVTQKAARLTIEGNGERTSDSKVVNDMLRAAMEQDARNEAQKKSYSPVSVSTKKVPA